MYGSTGVFLLPVHLSQWADAYHFKLRHGLAPWGESRELGFVLDFDCYSEGEIDLDGLVERCERYHDVIYNAFRWCIREGELPADIVITNYERLHYFDQNDFTG